MPCPPYCLILLQCNGTEDNYRVAPTHYEYLKDQLDKHQAGFVELELYEHPAGRLLVKLEDIKHLMHAPFEWVAAADALAEQQRQENIARGLS